MIHGIRFAAKVPVLVESESVVKHFRDRDDFEVQEEKIIPLEDLTVPQLKDKAKAANIEGFADMKKLELIKALKGEEDQPPTGNKAEGADGKGADSNDPPTA
ncbi:Rho termination factor N-terminal domain-containing protein [Paenibacillus sp. JX-17]|uniref:Rho termination factor N-terminal domain-containing protein n=1 Tax=Paenibacillus lacisoli TaxID=3064525 RepID=A0ABT9CGM8_9BACL|nr:Rho termination factor N-terminal domain-containing protein [Paenibacillus sp. JX-17]MDO7908434.1 Rho termination factor N-terminal domain-containing protein [Paenibacillus sp. JX-17]